MQHTVLPALADPLFQLQIAPDAAFPHSAWQQARAVVLEALEIGGIAVLLGPPGSGKSLLLKELARTLRQAGKPARLIERTDALDGPPGSGILLVDEADTLSPDALAALCAGPAPVVLAALPGFVARLIGTPRPVQEAVLDRLRPQDVARYVAARLDAVGRPRNLIEAEAVLALARHSNGLLRLINTLGGAAVFLAGLDESEHVSRRHVDEAASMRDDFGEEGFEQDAVTPFQAEPVHVALPPDSPVLIASRPVAPLPVEAPPVASLQVSPAVAEPAPTDVTTPAPTPLPPMPNFRAEKLRRRAALGTMATASAVLFALPWLTRRQPDAQTSLGQATADPVSPASTVPPLAVADSEAASPAAPGIQAAQAPASQTSTAQTAATRLDVPAPPAAAPSLPHAEPVRRADKALSAPTAELRVTMPPGAPVLFQGPIYNETMGQGGHVALVIRREAPGGAITARFDASQGLLGSGVLAGSMSGAGRITASGLLMVGKNPFNCDLSGTIVGDKLTGSASFVRNGGSGWAARSVFTLTRA